MKAEVKTVAAKQGMVLTAGGWRPADQVAAPAAAKPATRASLPAPVTQSSLATPAGVSAAFARNMARLNVNIAETVARDSHGARDLAAEVDAVKWTQVARVLKEEEKQRKMAAFNGYAARGGGYVRR